MQNMVVKRTISNLEEEKIDAYLKYNYFHKEQSKKW